MCGYLACARRSLEESAMKHHKYHRRASVKEERKFSCIFHNDGVRVYVFPEMWQAMYDFMKHQDQFVLQAGSDRQQAVDPWASGVGGPSHFHFQGHDKHGKVHIVLEGVDWEPVHVHLRVNRSQKVHMSRGSPSCVRLV